MKVIMSLSRQKKPLHIQLQPQTSRTRPKWGVVLAALLVAALLFIPSHHHGNLRQETDSLTPRLLQQENIQTTLMKIAPYLDWSLAFIILSMVTNTFVVFLPLILFMESFYFLGFIGVERGMLGDFFKAYLNGPISTFGIIKTVYGAPTALESTGLTIQLIDAGGRLHVLTNVIPALGVMGVLFAITIVAVVINLITKNQKLRWFVLVLKSIWNGTMYCLAPHIFFGMGVSSFFLNVDTKDQIINIVIYCACGVVMVVYPILLILQIRTHVNLPSDNDAKMSVSLVKPLKSSLFRFDCIIFSHKYFYVQGYLKTVVYFFGVGISLEYPKVAVGMCLLGELIEFIIFITNPCYIKTRHNIVCGSCFVILMLNAFCLLLVDLNQIVGNLAAANVFIYVLLILYAVGVVGLLVNAIIDIVEIIKRLRLQNSKERIAKKHSSEIEIYAEESDLKLDIDEKDNPLPLDINYLHIEDKDAVADNLEAQPETEGKVRRRKRKLNTSVAKTDASISKGTITEKDSRLKISLFDEKENWESAPKIKKAKRAREI